VKNFGGDLELKQPDLKRPSRLSRLNSSDSQVYFDMFIGIFHEPQDVRFAKMYGRNYQ